MDSRVDGKGTLEPLLDAIGTVGVTTSKAE